MPAKEPNRLRGFFTQTGPWFLLVPMIVLVIVAIAVGRAVVASDDNSGEDGAIVLTEDLTQEQVVDLVKENEGTDVIFVPPTGEEVLPPDERREADLKREAEENATIPPPDEPLPLPDCVRAADDARDTGGLSTTLECAGQVVSVAGHSKAKAAAADRETVEHALRLALSGPSARELALGFTGFFDGDVSVLSVEYREGAAVISLSKEMADMRAANTTGSQQLLLYRTLYDAVFQFAEVETVEFQIDGSCAAFWRARSETDCRIETREIWAGAVAGEVQTISLEEARG